jgi:hypothetical protein
MHGVDEKRIKILARKLGRHRCEQEDYIKMDLKIIGYEDVDLTCLEQGPKGSCKHGNEPLNSIKGRNFWMSSMTVSFSRRILLHGVN